MTSLRAFSFGGGVQSTAALALAAAGELEYRTFLFANVGDDSEHPETLRYVREVAMPFAAEHGLELLELERGGKRPTLLGKIRDLDRGLPFPVRMDGSGAPGLRSCTYDYKIVVVGRELKRRGATADSPATLGLGITVDELERMREPIDPKRPEQRRAYPLIDRRLTRQDCLNLIARAGLPTPGRSACWFCPFHNLEDWRRLRREQPGLFERSCELEELLQDRRRRLGKDPVWLTGEGARDRLSLRRLVGDDNQLSFDDLDEVACESGYCMT